MSTITLTRQQIAAVKMVQQNQISILTGGPGTGKTTAVLQVIRWAEREKLRYLQAAPTGKAAKRMMEASGGRYASTIHAMLGCSFNGSGFTFNHDENHPLRCDLIILDEISMLTNSLLADVMRAIDIRKTKILFVGDQDQLPSVGAGAVLRDMLHSGLIPHTELDVIHRNAGTIVEVCAAIKSGKGFSPAQKLDLEADSPVNLIHVECFTPEDTLRAVEAIMCDRMPLRGYDPLYDVQVISPVNKNGPLSCASINELIRVRLNPPNDINQHDRFRPGDKVINTKNQVLQGIDNTAEGIVNGDIGFITEVEKRYITVKFLDPEREVEIPKSDQHLLHAYCITCHRFQGSEAPVIIIPVHAQFDFFLSNSWIYTAISRAKQICITVGKFGTIERAIKNKLPNNRCTMLQDRLSSVDTAMSREAFATI